MGCFPWDLWRRNIKTMADISVTRAKIETAVVILNTLQWTSCYKEQSRNHHEPQVMTIRKIILGIWLQRTVQLRLWPLGWDCVEWQHFHFDLIHRDIFIETDVFPLNRKNSKYQSKLFCWLNYTLVFKGEVTDDKLSWLWETDWLVFPFAPPGDIFYAWGAARSVKC